MSITQKLQDVLQIKSDLAVALGEKGVVPSEQFSSFPDAVRSIETGGTQSGFEVRYFDYDGTILKTEYVEQGLDSTPPTVPTHAFLTFQEWNNATTNIQHDMDIGATYITTDGKTMMVVNAKEFNYPMYPSNATTEANVYHYYYNVGSMSSPYYYFITTNSKPYKSGNNVVFPDSFPLFVADQSGNWSQTSSSWMTRYPSETLIYSNHPIYTDNTYTVIDSEAVPFPGAIPPTVKLNFWKSNTDELLIEWGDTTQTVNSIADFTDATHSYTNEGIYNIKISIPLGIGTYRIGEASGGMWSQSFKPFVEGFNDLKEIYLGNVDENVFYAQCLSNQSLLEIVTIPNNVAYTHTFPFGSGFITGTSLKHLTVPMSFLSFPSIQTGSGLNSISLPMKTMTQSGASSMGADKLILPIFSGTTENSFSGCYAKKIIWTGGSMGLRTFQNSRQVREFTMLSGNVGAEALYGLNSLENITLKSGVNSFGQMSWWDIVLVKKIDFPDTLTFVSGTISSTKLNTLIFRSLTPPTMGQSNAIAGSPLLKIYVPDASVDAYKTATNWVAYVNKIFPLSELEG